MVTGSMQFIFDIDYLAPPIINEKHIFNESTVNSDS